jgi:hypothetical protein
MASIRILSRRKNGLGLLAAQAAAVEEPRHLKAI